jgi:spermidine/putrescine transport system substrate-binding protein
MKKVLLVFTVFIFGVVLTSCEARPTLKVFMPNEYIDESLYEAFEDEFNVRVELITFDSNETALPQIKVNSYDVVIPSDYAIEELAKGGFLETLDWTKLDSMSKSDLDPALTTLISEIGNEADGFDLLDVAVPYFWGNVGLLYDTNKVTESQMDLEGWNILNTINDNVMFYDSQRDMVMIALKALFEGNVDVNNPTTVQLTQAEDWLKGSNRNARVTYASDEIFDDMLDPTKYAVAVSYSGDAVYLMSENEDLGYYVPPQGSNVWVDAMVIPKNATQKELAYAFINYFSSSEIMYSNSEYIGYTAPRLDVATLILTNEVYDASSYKVVVTSNDSVFRYNEANKQAIAELWARVRAAN